MPRNPTTGAFVRVDNSFSDPVQGTVIDENDANVLWADYDDGLSGAMATFKPPRIITAAGAVTVAVGDTQILMNKTVGAATTVNLPTVADRIASGNGLPLVVKDQKGDAGTNNITIDASGAETIDGLSTLVLASNGAAVTILPSSTLGGWYSAP